MRRFRSASVVLGIGGKQEVPSWVVDAGPTDAAFYTSNHVLMKAGLEDVSKQLTSLRAVQEPAPPVAKSPKRRKSLIEPKATPKRRIIIIGGSHSAFSVAWVLLNHIAKDTVEVSASAAVPIEINTAATGTDTGVTTTSDAAETKSSSPMDLETELKNAFKELDVPRLHLELGEIVIMHRSNVKLFYKGRAEESRIARKYKLPAPVKMKGERATAKGHINSFSGLRGGKRRYTLFVLLNSIYRRLFANFPTV